MRKIFKIFDRVMRCRFNDLGTLSKISKVFSEMHIDSKNSEKIHGYLWLLNIVLSIFFRTFGSELRLEKNKSCKTRF